MKRRNFISKALGMIGVGVLTPTMLMASKKSVPSAKELEAEILSYGFYVQKREPGVKLSEVSMRIYHSNDNVTSTVRLYTVTDIKGKNPIHFVQRFFQEFTGDGKLYKLNTQSYMTDNWKEEVRRIMTKKPEELKI